MWFQVHGFDLEAFATDHTDDTRTFLWILWCVIVPLTAWLVARRARTDKLNKGRWIAGGVAVFLIVTALALGVPWYLGSVNVEPYALTAR